MATIVGTEVTETARMGKAGPARTSTGRSALEPTTTRGGTTGTATRMAHGTRRERVGQERERRPRRPWQVRARRERRSRRREERSGSTGIRSARRAGEAAVFPPRRDPVASRHRPEAAGGPRQGARGASGPRRETGSRQSRAGTALRTDGAPRRSRTARPTSSSRTSIAPATPTSRSTTSKTSSRPSRGGSPRRSDRRGSSPYFSFAASPCGSTACADAGGGATGSARSRKRGRSRRREGSPRPTAPTSPPISTAGSTWPRESAPSCTRGSSRTRRSSRPRPTPARPMTPCSRDWRRAWPTFGLGTDQRSDVRRARRHSPEDRTSPYVFFRSGFR